MNGTVIRKIDELGDLQVGALPARPEPQRVLMCTPDYFDVVDVKNTFMEGNIGGVDHARATAEWNDLRRAFESLGHEVVTIPGVEGLEDMVFCANQVLPGLDGDGRPYAVLSRMRHESRRREVPHFAAWFEARGYQIRELPESVQFFEGQGDAIWHPGRRLLWGGCGQRTALTAYQALAALLDVLVIALDLVHPDFYHLDTAFCALSEQAVLVFPAAFSSEGMRLIERLFSTVVAVPESEARDALACNALALDGKTVVIQRGATATVVKLRAAGFDVVEVETGEFMKSGGSVFCMKMMVY
jgi:N-dimethylarginine dimethylaminohydrolase